MKIFQKYQIDLAKKDWSLSDLLLYLAWTTPIARSTKYISRSNQKESELSVPHSYTQICTAIHRSTKVESPYDTRVEERKTHARKRENIVIEKRMNQRLRIELFLLFFFSFLFFFYLVSFKRHRERGTGRLDFGLRSRPQYIPAELKHLFSRPSPPFLKGLDATNLWAPLDFSEYIIYEHVFTRRPCL
jgi:hypothetical protein